MNAVRKSAAALENGTSRIALRMDRHAPGVRGGDASVAALSS
jgi:hypothetical protein